MRYPTIKRLMTLLEEGHEHETLDYKDRFASDDKASWVELAKDVGAMMIDGGDIVLGADGRGRPSGLLTSHDARRLDEAVVRAKLKTWIAEPFDVRTQQHEQEGCRLVLVSVSPHPDGFCVFKSDGVSDGKQAFRAGDVFARHGSASERWNQADVARIQRHLRARAEEPGRKKTRDFVLPRGRQVAGQCDAMLLALGKAAGTPLDRRDLTPAKLDDACSRVDPKSQAPLLVGGDPVTGWRYATWWMYLLDWRRRSATFAADIRVLSPFLDPTYLTLLMQIETCSYFMQLDALVRSPPANDNLSWLSGCMWKYVLLTDDLTSYLDALALEDEVSNRDDG